jgi:hypothetical protein
MNTSDQVRMRKTRRESPSLEQLDARVVPSAMQAAGAAAAATTAQEIRVDRLIARRELRLEAREARLEARDAAHHHASAAIRPQSVASTFKTVAGTPVTTTTQSKPTSQSSGNVAPAAPVSTSSPSGNSSPASPTSTTSPASPVVTANPLPANVALALDTIYEQYENGTLGTPTGGQPIQIQGDNVGVMIHVTNPADFASDEAAAVALGLQVNANSPQTDTVAGFLPIAELPSAAQLANVTIAPVYVAMLN